ncbi:MAG: hydrogenase maturation nickel metallochaperone HypA [Rhodobacteraceae bacterium]|nr:hydrogenase maturation nickel metallochaperone HypA [Paracoccaceae bacterium]
MHEMALAEGVLGIVEQTVKGQSCTKVTKVRLEIGELSHVAPEALRFCFKAVMNGTIAQGATLEIDRTPGRAWCHDCGQNVPVSTLGAPCPECDGFKLQITGGEDMRVRDMEVE